MSYWAVRTVTSGVHLSAIPSPCQSKSIRPTASLANPIAQDGPVEVGVKRLAVQGRQHGLRGAAEVDGNFVGHVWRVMRESSRVTLA